MPDFNKARINMVDCQIRPNEVTSPNVLEAFLTVPREAFVSDSQKSLAYRDGDLPLLDSAQPRCLMDAMSMARLVQLADVQAEDIVLDIGCASGYSTAILSHLCASVVALENDEALSEQAGKALSDSGCDNTVVVSGPLEKGYAKEGPYDVIFVGGSVDQISDALLQQLKEGGRLVAVEGQGNAGCARLYKKQNGITHASVAFNCALMPLPGFEKAADFVF